MLFGYGVAKVGLEERPDGEGFGVEGRFCVEALRPYMIRLAPANFVIDPRSDSVDSARFLGHRFQRDVADLQADVLRGRKNIAKRAVIHAGGFNMGLLMRVKYGLSRPRSLSAAVFMFIFGLRDLPARLWTSIRPILSVITARSPLAHLPPAPARRVNCTGTSATGC